MADTYSLWSATNIVQIMSAHTSDTKEMTKYLGFGQKAHFWYGHRPKHDKEDTYRDTDLGVMNELQNQFTAMHKRKNKDTPTEGTKLIQHIQHMDYTEIEVSRLLTKLPRDGH